MVFVCYVGVKSFCISIENIKHSLSRCISTISYIKVRYVTKQYLKVEPDVLTANGEENNGFKFYTFFLRENSP